MEIVSVIVGVVTFMVILFGVFFFFHVSEKSVEPEDFFALSLMSFTSIVLLLIMLGISVKNTELISYRRILNGNSVVRTLDNCKFVVYVGNEDSENVITSLCKVEE